MLRADAQVPDGRRSLPLEGLRVLEFCHTIMGPSCTLLLADLGAEVIKVEPVGGERTRILTGFGAGYFDFFNRNKQSIAIDLKSAEGLALVIDLLATVDVLVENFAPGTMARLNLGHDDLKDDFPRLIYCSLKGFLPGPHGDRVALDETTQMMSGLAYMTGPSGRPLRAGASVIDIMGGMFGAFGIQAALIERAISGRGQLVESGLFETASFLMGQHLAYASKVGGHIPPMPERVSAWSVYELFPTSDGKQFFIGIVSDAQWRRFCEVFGADDLAADSSLATNNKRIFARDRIVPRIAALIGAMDVTSAERLSLEAGIAFAAVIEPLELLTNEHLVQSGAFLDTRLSNGSSVPLPRLPMRMDHRGFDLRCDPPVVGDATSRLMEEIGRCEADIEDLTKRGILGATSNDMLAQKVG